MRSPREAAGRRRRRIMDSNASTERVLELTPASTLATVFFLLAVGATLATCYIVMNSSNDCMMGGYRASVSMNEDQSTAQYPGNLRNGVYDVGDSSPSLLNTPIVPTADNFPAACTAEQGEKVKKQLRPEGCFGGHPWIQSCSFTQATRGCQDHFWMTEMYAQQSFDQFPFVAIMVGWPKGLGKVDFFMGALQLGTKDPIHYDASKILTKFGNPENPCNRSTPIFSGTAAASTKVYVLERESEKLQDLKAIRKEYNAENHLIIETKDFSISKSASGNLDDWVKERLPQNDDPIHHLSINMEGLDFEILMGASNMLNRVRYVDFEVQWKSEWNKGSLSILIRKLKTRGFVCYFSGTHGNLWRITDCWMNHYGEKHWGRIACVNAHHSDVNGILDRMEKGFLNTLSKAISFGY
jgi:hypothetical protein